MNDGEPATLAVLPVTLGAGFLGLAYNYWRLKKMVNVATQVTFLHLPSIEIID